jgi:hypothetical protein
MRHSANFLAPGFTRGRGMIFAPDFLDPLVQPRKAGPNHRHLGLFG